MGFNQTMVIGPAVNAVDRLMPDERFTFAPVSAVVGDVAERELFERPFQAAVKFAGQPGLRLVRTDLAGRITRLNP
jgi:hypothetical protein